MYVEYLLDIRIHLHFLHIRDTLLSVLGPHAAPSVPCLCQYIAIAYML